MLTMNHPNRSAWRSVLPEPTPADMRRYRGDLTQNEAATLAGYSSGVKWAQFEAGDRRPSEQALELYLLRTDQHPTLRLIER